MDPCLDNLEKYEGAGTEEALDLFVFYTWQELTLIKKQGLCDDVSSQDLKKFALASGLVYLNAISVGYTKMQCILQELHLMAT